MLQRADLWSLEEYSERREDFRRSVMAHRKNRRLLLGDHILLLFEDTITIKYQIQEMLRVERIFDADGIQAELDAYNPLIPDGDNWKCSMLIQYEDENERRQRLSELVGVEDRVWVGIGDLPRLYPISDEDMERSQEDKTASVHFLRYQLDDVQIEALKSGSTVTAGVEHPGYPCRDVTMNEEMRSAIIADLN